MSDPSKRGVLVFITGSNKDEVIKLRRDATIFGREKADIVLDDRELSATHCQIQKIEDEYHIFDMNSTNGTFINHDRIIKAKLKEGDEITIGSSTFKFMLQDEKELRHITTVFKQRSSESTRSTIVDTLIESELRSTQGGTIEIRVTYGNGVSEVIKLHQRMVYIGRASSFGKFDKDTQISRKHLLIKLNDQGELFIEDQGSTNGSFLNNEKLSGMTPVSEDDEIRIGDCTLRVSAKAS